MAGNSPRSCLWATPCPGLVCSWTCMLLGSTTSACVVSTALQSSWSPGFLPYFEGGHPKYHHHVPRLPKSPGSASSSPKNIVKLISWRLASHMSPISTCLYQAKSPPIPGIGSDSKKRSPRAQRI
ncbi:hypothetical protein BD779DRAFT_290517 [Infundibulicybe gibba]|nr:hypothetical protein BD779DRAFT_290517 [Infundibulicybe gibba]